MRLLLPISSVYTIQLQVSINLVIKNFDPISHMIYKLFEKYSKHTEFLWQKAFSNTMGTYQQRILRIFLAKWFKTKAFELQFVKISPHSISIFSAVCERVIMSFDTFLLCMYREHQNYMAVESNFDHKGATL